MMTTNYKSLTNKFSLWFTAAVVLCLLTVSTGVYAQKKAPEKKSPPDKILNGKTYTIEITEQGGKKAKDPENDEINFKSGKFTSKLMKTDNQFAPGSYTVTPDSTDASKITYAFEVESQNTSEETLKWTGTVSGDDIEGTAVWTNKKGKTKKEYAFTGSLKGKKKKKEKEVE